MHIVIFTDFHDSSVGGVQTSVRSQRKGLENAGHTVTIVCPPPLVKVDADPAVIIAPEAPFAPNGYSLAIPSRIREFIIVRQLAQRPPIDVIHVQTNMGVGIMGVRIAKRLGLALVQTMHGRDDVLAESTFPVPALIMGALAITHNMFIPHRTVVSGRLDSSAAKSAWNIMINHAQAADYVVMPSQHFADKFKERGLMQPVSVVSNGLDDDMLASLRLSSRVRKADEPLKAIWCGRVSAEKRPLVCLEAIRMLDNVTLDIYGEGAELEAVRLYIKKHKLSERVRVCGRKSQIEIIEAMSDHDVLLYSSYGFDNQPMVLLEAVAAGLPVIYCDPDLTECGPVGGMLLTKDALAGGFVEAIQQLLDSPALLNQMKAIVEQNSHTVAQSIATKQLVELYERVAKTR